MALPPVCDLTALSQALSSSDPDEQMRTLDACMAVLTDPTLWLWMLAFTVISALVGALIGKMKHAVLRDTLLGLAFGPVGWAISLMLPAKKM
ncbi:MAG: hypothetical protein JSR65_05700 [Proteobacteria bacterium]|nr:hypothetical protein [Pseudomonadota bacterium]